MQTLLMPSCLLPQSVQVWPRPPRGRRRQGAAGAAALDPGAGGVAPGSCATCWPAECAPCWPVADPAGVHLTTPPCLPPPNCRSRCCRLARCCPACPCLRGTQCSWRRWRRCCSAPWRCRVRGAVAGPALPGGLRVPSRCRPDTSACLPRSPACPTINAGQVIQQQDHILHSVVFVRQGYVDLSVQVGPGPERSHSKRPQSRRWVPTGPTPPCRCPAVTTPPSPRRSMRAHGQGCCSTRWARRTSLPSWRCCRYRPRGGWTRS